MTEHLWTPDGRYFIVRGRLWRLSNPELDPGIRLELVGELMRCRRRLRARIKSADSDHIRAEVDRIKRALGERGPVWWFDGSPDYNKRLVKNTPYRTWYQGVKDTNSRIDN